MTTGSAEQQTAPGGDSGPVDVFLSYNSRDHEIVVRLAEGLSAAGLKPFLDRWDLAPGLRWRKELETVLEGCRAVVVCLGPQGLGEVQQREVDVALRRQDKEPRFPVIPVLLPGGEAPSGFLAQLTWVDLRNQPVSEGVSDLARAIRGVWAGPELREKGRLQRRRYLVNLLLLLATLLVLAVWYGRHLHARVAHIAVGGSITVLALLRFAYDYLRWGAEDQIKGWSKRLLGSRWSTRALAIGLGASVALHAVTTSMSLVWDEGSGQGGVAVRVRDGGGRVLWTSPELGAKRTFASRLFFFRLGRAAELQLEPAGDRAMLAVRLRPGSRLEVRVPGSFAAREIRLLRILPGLRLLNLVGAPEAQPIRRYTLQWAAAGRTNTLADLRQQAVYLGATAEDLALGLERETEASRRARLEGWARARLPGAGDAQREALLRRWLTPRQAVLGSGVPDAGAIRCLLVAEDDGSTRALEQSVLDESPPMQTLWIDLAP